MLPRRRRAHRREELAARDHRELAIRFVLWAARLEDTYSLGFFEDELAQFDPPTDPDGPDEQPGPFIDELDFV